MASIRLSLVGAMKEILVTEVPLDEGSPVGFDRRTLLKRSAVAGGALVWATPIVQSIGSPAFAAVSPPPATSCCVHFSKFGDFFISTITVTWYDVITVEPPVFGTTPHVETYEVDGSGNVTHTGSASDPFALVLQSDHMQFIGNVPSSDLVISVTDQANGKEQTVSVSFRNCQQFSITTGTATCPS